MPRSRSAGRHRTPQQRKRAAASRRAAELELDEVEEAPAAPSRRGAGAGRGAGSGRPQSPAGTLLSRLFTRETRPPTRAERDDTPWTLRGRLTLALLIILLVMPVGVLNFLTTGGTIKVSLDDVHTTSYHYSLAYFLVIPLAPSPIPVLLVLSTLIGMPLARKLAEEPRSYRVLETLGFAAVVDIVLLVVWGVLPHNVASFTDGKVVAAAGALSIIAVFAGAYLYGPISAFLSPRRRAQR